MIGREVHTTLRRLIPQVGSLQHFVTVGLAFPRCPTDEHGLSDFQSYQHVKKKKFKEKIYCRKRFLNESSSALNSPTIKYAVEVVDRSLCSDYWSLAF